MNAIAINQQEASPVFTTEQHRSEKVCIACVRFLGRTFEIIAGWFGSPDLSLEEWERIESKPKVVSRISESRRWL